MEWFAKKGAFVVLVFVMAAVPSACSFADWQVNGNPLCTATGEQEFPQIVWDGAGGAIITWHDTRGGNYDIYIQRADSLGAAIWSADGDTVCVARSYQQYPQIVSDGAGGAIITWEDLRGDSNSVSIDIYAQSVNALGVAKWNTGGVAICTARSRYYAQQYSPQIVSDGAGGAIITWDDDRNGDYDIYAQRVDAQGAVKWTVNGNAVCAASGNQWAPQIVSDGAGGAIITWYDYRGGQADIYAQHLDEWGAGMWIANGVAVCTATGGQWEPQIVSDGAGGAIIAWHDTRGATDDIYAQRIDTLGAVKWGTNGDTVCVAAGNQGAPQLVSDGAGGAIVTWEDNRSNNYDTYAQHLDATGNATWGMNGVGVCTATGNQWAPQVVLDGVGGAIITWEDYRSGNSDIYAQRLDGTGAAMWTANGVAICTAASGQWTPQIVLDGFGGVIITWDDTRSGTSDIYAQRVRMDDGRVYLTDLIFALASARAEQGHVSLSWRVTMDVPGSEFLIKRSEAPDRGFVTLDVLISRETGSLFSCIDYSVVPGNTYWYQIVLSGPSVEEVYGPIEVYVGQVPVAYRAYQNYPNPFNPVCTIRYDIPQPNSITLRIFGADGSLVRTLVRGWREPGVHNEIWDGRGDDGTALPSGVYFYRLEAGKFVATRKMVLLK